VEVIDYLNGGLSKELLGRVTKALKVRPKEILRTKEEEFKRLKLDVENDEEVLNAILKHPIILERPIVVKGDQGVIGRPPENILKLL
jgi:arsenate reductase